MQSAWTFSLRKTVPSKEGWVSSLSKEPLTHFIIISSRFSPLQESCAVKITELMRTTEVLLLSDQDRIIYSCTRSFVSEHQCDCQSALPNSGVVDAVFPPFYGFCIGGHLAAPSQQQGYCTMKHGHC